MDYIELSAFGIVASSPFIFMLFSVPAKIYFRNQGELEYRSQYLLWIGLMVALLPLVGTLVMATVPPFPNIAFYAWLFFMVRDQLLPPRLKDFKGGLVLNNLLVVPGATLIEVALIGLAAVGVVFLPIEGYVVWAAAAVLFFTVDALIDLVRSVRPLVCREQDKPGVFRGEVGGDRGRGNVYHLVFDSYFGPGMSDYLETRGANGEFLDGFEYFPNVVSNYDHTHPSVASFMTGKYIQPDAVKSYVESWKSGGVIGAFAASGYHIWQYVVSEWWLHDDVRHWCTLDRYLSPRTRLLEFLDLVLLRMAPSALRSRLFSESGCLGFLSARLVPDIVRSAPLNSLPYGSARLFNDLMDEELTRPAQGQYVHAHFYLPHMPYIFDENGNAGESDFQRQMRYTTVLIDRFLQLLKEQGKYENATIVLQSDHAVAGGRPGDGLLYRVGDSGMTHQKVNEVRPLLLIKREGAQGEVLKVSNSYVQLADVAPTLMGMHGLQGEDGTDGADLYTQDRHAEREMSVWTGYYQKGLGHFGLDWTEGGALNHCVFNNRTGWRSLPDTEVVWDSGGGRR